MNFEDEKERLLDEVEKRFHKLHEIYQQDDFLNRLNPEFKDAKANFQSAEDRLFEFKEVYYQARRAQKERDKLNPKPSHSDV